MPAEGTRAFYNALQTVKSSANEAPTAYPAHCDVWVFSVSLFPLVDQEFPSFPPACLCIHASVFKVALADWPKEKQVLFLVAHSWEHGPGGL